MKPVVPPNSKRATTASGTRRNTPKRCPRPAGWEAATDAETPDQPPAAGFRRVPNQRGVGEGEVRLYCDACQKSFTALADQQPDSCPEGHGPDAAQPEAPED